MWAAIRYRRAQALVLVLLAALIATCAAFAPLYERALEQSLLRIAIDQSPASDTALSVRGGRSEVVPDRVPRDLAKAVPPSLAVLYRPPVGQMTDSISIQPRAGLKPSPGRLVTRTGVCDHVTITEGTCPENADEVMVSAKDLAAWKWPIGKVLTTPIPGTDAAVYPRPPQQQATLKVVGAYQVRPDPTYWMRSQLDGKSGVLVAVGTEQVPGLDDFVTVESTFGKQWSHVGSTLTFPLRRELISIDNLDAVTAILQSRASRGASANADAVVESQLPSVIASVKGGQKQLRVIVPLLMAQLGLLAAAILFLVAQAAVEQRRPESALARLRGRSREGAGLLVMAELGATVALGLPLGGLLAVALSELVRRTLLADGVPFEFPWLAVVGLVAAAAVCAVAIVVAVRPLRRQSISALLRRVAPARRGGLGIVDILAVALAAFGLVGLGTGTLKGPLALLTPTLIALAGGLVASRLAVPIARAAGRTQLRRGRVGQALTAYGLERRPALRKVVTIVSVAVALTVFAANALVVADRNWQARAQLEVGAPLVIDTDSRNPNVLASTVRALDPTGATVTPVAVVRQLAAGSTPTIAVIGSQFGQVAYAPGGQDLRLGQLRPPDVPTVALDGKRVTGRVTWRLASSTGFADGTGAADLAPVVLRISVTTAKGERLLRDLAALPANGSGSRAVDAPLLCPDGCRLDGISVTPSAQASTNVIGSITLSGLAVDGTRLDVSDPARWNSFTALASGSNDSLSLSQPTPGTLKLDLQSSGVTVGLGYADVPAQVSGLLAGPVPAGGTPESFTAVGLNGAPVTVAATQQPGALPLLGARGVMVDYETLQRLGGSLATGGTLSVWVHDPGQDKAVRAALAKAGIGVLASHSYAAAKERLDTSGSGWGVRLAAFTGLMAVLLAALVMVVMTVTGWRTVARDLAALHMAGVGMKVLRRSLVREQAIVVTVGALVGAVCGTIAAIVAMPLLPLFDDPAPPVPALQIDPSSAAVVGATVLALVVLLVVAVSCATVSGRRIALRRVRETL